MEQFLSQSSPKGSLFQSSNSSSSSTSSSSTSSSTSRWPKVNRHQPCPTCGKKNKCLLAPDGTAVLCWRSAAGADQGKVRQLDKPAKPRPSATTHKKLTASLHNGNKSPGQGRGATRPAAKADLNDFARACAKPAGTPPTRLAGLWTYTDAQARPVMAVVRLDVLTRRGVATGEKRYLPTHRKKGQWHLGDPDGALPLYRRPSLTEPTGPVVIVEGEKAADALADALAGCGLTVTTTAHGASAPGKSDLSPLDGREVWLLPDHDHAGRRYTKTLARLLLARDDTRAVRRLDVAALAERLGQSLDVGEDVADLIERHANAGQDKVDVHDAMRDLAGATACTDAGKFLGAALLTKLGDETAKAVEWLWPGVLPLGALTVVAGEPGGGKTMLTMADWAGRVSAGLPWPGPDENAPHPAHKPGGVVLISGEDDPARTLLPRLLAHGGNADRVLCAKGVSRPDDRDDDRDDDESSDVSNDDKSARAWSLSDLPYLRRAIRSAEVAGMAPVKLVVIDPVSSFLRGTDGNNNTELRALLTPLRDWAEEAGLAVVLVTHLKKHATGRATDAVIGSIGQVGAARSAWMLAKDKRRPRQRNLLPIKNNLGSDTHGYAFELVEVESTTGPGTSVLRPMLQTATTADTALGDASEVDHDVGDDPADSLLDLL